MVTPDEFEQAHYAALAEQVQPAYEQHGTWGTSASGNAGSVQHLGGPPSGRKWMFRAQSACSAFPCSRGGQVILASTADVNTPNGHRHSERMGPRHRGVPALPNASWSRPFLHAATASLFVHFAKNVSPQHGQLRYA